MAKILQGSVLTQTVLDVLLTIYLPVANFLQCIICAKNYDSWLTVDKVIATIINSLLFIGPPCISDPTSNQSCTYTATQINITLSLHHHTT